MKIDLIVNAFLNLLDRMDFDEITVKAICEEAKVHRTTFYNHFENKNHLFDFIIKGLQDDFENEIYTEEEFNSPEKFYTALIGFIIDYIDKNKRKYIAIMQLQSRYALEDILNNTISKSIQFRLIKYQKQGYHYSVPLNIITEFFIGGVLFTVNYWIKNNDMYTANDIKEYLIHLLKL